MRPASLVCLLLASLAFAQTRESASSQITVGSISIRDTTNHLSPVQEQEIAADIVGKSYKADGLEEISASVRYACQIYGFFGALVSTPVATSSRSGPQGKTVDLALEVVAGEQYRLSEILFTGGNVFAASELRSRFEIRDGEVFNIETIRKGLEALRLLYAKDGYINLTPVPNTSADGQAHTVSLKIDLDEGQQFRVGKLIINGDEDPEPPCKAQLLREWKRYEGQVYDPDVLTKFLNDNFSVVRHGVNPERDSEIISRAAAATVDVAVEMPDAAGCKSNSQH